MNTFDVTFKLIDETRAHAFVNGQMTGNVRLMTIKNVLRLTFRNSRNPFKNYVRTSRYALEQTMSALIVDHYVLRELMPIVIRNYLRN